MKRVITTVVPLGAVVLLILAVSAWAAPATRHGGGGRGDHRGQGRTITVIEHATTDATTDTGAAGDSNGDILTFANDVFDATNTTKVGTDQGYCIRVVAGASYECTWTVFLDGGQIVVNGPFFDAKNSTLAITGGTGRFRGARGEMELQSRPGGTEFAFVYHVKR